MIIRMNTSTSRAAVCASILTITCCVASFGEYRLESVAGTGAPENNGDTGCAHEVNIGEPFGVELGPDGALYITEVRNHRVLRLDFGTGKVSAVAGCGRRGYSGDGGLATAAELNEPYEVRFDEDGNMLFVEMRNHLIRRVHAKTGVISTVAGTGRPGFSGDGGPATQAMLNQPHSIALDNKGAIYIADIGNHRIRRVDPETGIVDSVAGNSKRGLPRDGQPARGNPILGPRALFIDADTMWIALREGHSTWRMELAEGILHHVAGTGEPGFAGDGGPAALAQFNGPKGIAVGPDKLLYVADTENHAVRVIDIKSEVISTIAGRPLDRPHGICVTPSGEVFVGDTLNHRVVRVK